MPKTSEVGNNHQSKFGQINHFLNTATIGIPPLASVHTMAATLQSWQEGTLDIPSFDSVIRSACSNFAKLVNTSPEKVGIISQLSTVAAMIASSLPVGSRILVAKEDFTSVLFPFLVAQQQNRLKVVVVELERLVEAIDETIDLVAVSAVQSSDGRVLDLEALAMACRQNNVKSFVDMTQSAGWLSTFADDFDVVACHAYKWLCSPRGTGFVVIQPNAQEWLVPIFGGWYAGDDPWDSIYGPPLRLAKDARAYQVSPDWLSWGATEIATKTLCDVGVKEIGSHNVMLANLLRNELGMQKSNSAIVSMVCDCNPNQLLEQKIIASFRDGRLRTSFHLYNTVDDVDALLKFHASIN